MSNNILTKPVWDALADEYTGGPDADPAGWHALLETVYAQTDDFCPLPNCVGDEGLTFTNHMLDGQTVVWEADRDASNKVDSFVALLNYYAAQWQTDTPIPVWNLRPNHPLFSNRDALAYQAWHDTGHIEYALSFSQDDELKLYARSAHRLEPIAQDALFGEIVYPLAAATKYDGYLEQQYTKQLGPVGQAVRDLLLALV